MGLLVWASAANTRSPTTVSRVSCALFVHAWDGCAVVFDVAKVDEVLIGEASEVDGLELVASMNTGEATGWQMIGPAI
ncbi:hypothetical protein ACWC2K_19395 [Streptomyces chattanoogensis]